MNDDITIESAAPNAKPVYWEWATGEIVGPATPLFLARYGNTFVVIVDYTGDWISINSMVWRSKRQFKRQSKPKPDELIRERR